MDEFTTSARPRSGAGRRKGWEEFTWKLSTRRREAEDDDIDGSPVVFWVRSTR